MKITSRFPLTVCPDCQSSHIGSPCGMTAAERFKTVKLGTEWMPSKMDSRARDAQRQDGNAKGYYDDEAVKEIFGTTGKENKEILMEETQGVGIATAEDIQKYPELVYEHYLNNPKDDVDA